ncbi:DUF1573 domain-containing protein [Oligosphaera ethanolica]|uniref:DUF1573 domain-containing protein n=1 Tax=Oligosphaera ethanolica TaxID=760260 RepID=A0AAE3VJM5_9BACT|nr:DUF1573 domain-containing protein [Oligosphaera ethanolica]MDQ0291413.1 hypothetical protein [Oligosphaera ethanolica]
MKRIKRHLPILFCFALLLFPAFSLRALELLPSAASLGRFPANQAQERVFTLRNSSEAAVVVDALRTSCGCLTADLSNREIPARGQASLTVRLPAEGVSGPFTHMVFLETGGEVRAVRLTGEAVPLVAVSPQRILAVGTLPAGQSCHQEFLLTTVAPAEFGEPETVGTGVAARLERQSDTRWTLAVTFTPEREETLFHHRVKLPMLSPAGWRPVEIILHGRVHPQAGAGP